MTVIYCGRCGSTVGVHARFCRLCGGDVLLHRGPSFPVVASPSDGDPGLETGQVVIPPASREKIVRLEGEAGADLSQKQRRGEKAGRAGIATQITRLPVSRAVVAELREDPSKSIEREIPQAVRPGREASETAGSAPPFSSSPMEEGQPGPSRVLASASGLQAISRREYRLWVGAILLALVLLTAGYLFFRDQLLEETGPTGVERQLLRAEDLSQQMVEKGKISLGQGEPEEALTHFRQALELTPGSQAILRLIAETYLERRQPIEARETYQALLRIAPGDLPARLKVAQLYQQANQWLDAQREYRHIIGLDQTSAEASAALEAIEAKEGRREVVRRRASPTPLQTASVQRSLPSVTQVPAEQPLAIPPAPLESSDPPLVMKEERMIEEPDPALLAQPRKDRGLRYLRIKEYRAAINELLHAVRIDPEDRDLFYHIGVAYTGLNQPVRAHDYFKRVDRGAYLSAAQEGVRKTAKAAEEARRLLNRQARPPSE